MRLFHQLSEEEQLGAVHYCIPIVAENMLEDGSAPFEPETEEDLAFHNKAADLLAQADALENIDEKIGFLLQDEDMSGMLHDVARDIAVSAFYHDLEELVIFPEHFKEASSSHEEEVLNNEKDPNAIDVKKLN